MIFNTQFTLQPTILALALVVPALAGCGDPEPTKVKVVPSPTAAPSPLHTVTGNVSPDWNAEMAGQPWAAEVVSVDWTEGLPWMRIVVTDSTSEEASLLVCRTGLKFFSDHTDGTGQMVRVDDSLGKVAEGASGRCRTTQG